MRNAPMVSCLVFHIAKVLSDNEWGQIQVPEQISGNTNTQQFNNYQQPTYLQEGYQQEVIENQQTPEYTQYSDGGAYQQATQHQTPQVYENSVYQQNGQVYQQPEPAQYYDGSQAPDTQYAYNVQQVNPSANGQQPTYPEQVPTYQDQTLYQSQPPPQNVQYPSVNVENNPTPYQSYANPIQPHGQAVKTQIQSRVDTVAPQSKFSTIMNNIREFVKSFFSNNEGTARNDSGFAAILSLSSLIIGSILYL
jgi:hypothetical protein